MALVDYSESDDSESETIQTSKSSANHTTKPTFQKVVDRSNPGKIKVSLPQAAATDDLKDDEPPAKRTKTGGGTFGGFNSFLPAPKRSTPLTSGVGLGGGSTARKGELNTGVSLKTGAAPGFSRDTEPRNNNTDEGLDSEQTQSAPGGLHLPPPKGTNPEMLPEEEVKMVGNPTMFRPLSVARKPTKKAKKQRTVAPQVPKAQETLSTADEATRQRQRPKVNLFSMSSESSSVVPVSAGEYQPIIYESPKVETTPASVQNTAHEDRSFIPASSANAGAQSLDDIASDLNLSAAERRQLFGRQKGGYNSSMTAHRVINFDTDQEYQHNEELRAAGEQVVHNPVRAIAPGKHSLKQLVNAAASQKEALEESFARGKNNRAEASSRYGW